MTARASIGDQVEFHVDTNFQRQARSLGGVTRTAALKNAKAAIEQIRRGHQDWPGKELDAFLALLPRHDPTIPQDTAWIDTAMFRLKEIADVAGTLGYPLLTFVAQNLRLILATMKGGARYHAEAMNCHLDALHLATQDRYREMSPGNLPELARGLKQVLDSSRRVRQTRDGRRSGGDQNTFSDSANESSPAEAIAS